jgi:hypothetical protein
MGYQPQMLQLLIGHDVWVDEITHINDVGLSELIHPWESVSPTSKSPIGLLVSWVSPCGINPRRDGESRSRRALNSVALSW